MTLDSIEPASSMSYEDAQEFSWSCQKDVKIGTDECSLRLCCQFVTNSEEEARKHQKGCNVNERKEFFAERLIHCINHEGQLIIKSN